MSKLVRTDRIVGLLHLAREALNKAAFVAAGGDPAAAGGAPPMDPAMMGGGAPPMDPAMMGGGAPPMDPAMMGGGGAPQMDPTAAMAATGVGADAGLQQMIQQAVQAAVGGGGGAAAGGGVIKPKIDVNVELMQIKNLLAQIADGLGLPISATSMVATPDKLTAMAQGGAEQPKMASVSLAAQSAALLELLRNRRGQVSPMPPRK